MGSRKPTNQEQECESDLERCRARSEIEKCTLCCIICHRLKTFKFGDGQKHDENYKGVVTRNKLLVYLEFKKERLEGDKNKGQCISYFKKCPMEQAINAFRKMNSKDFRTKVPTDVLVLTLFDFDHIDARTKIGSVGKLRSVVEAEKCNLSCCVCHRAKTMFKGDNSNRAWVAYRKKANEPLEGELGEEIGFATQAEAENKNNIQVDLDHRVEDF